MKVQNIIQFIRDPNLIGGDLSDYQETALRPWCLEANFFPPEGSR